MNKPLTVCIKYQFEDELHHRLWFDKKPAGLERQQQAVNNFQRRRSEFIIMRERKVTKSGTIITVNQDYCQLPRSVDVGSWCGTQHPEALKTLLPDRDMVTHKYINKHNNKQNKFSVPQRCGEKNVLWTNKQKVTVYVIIFGTIGDGCVFKREGFGAKADKPLVGDLLRVVRLEKCTKYFVL